MKRAAIALLLAVCPAARLPAQVGYEPARSPFRDITTRQSLTISGGWFAGNRARAHVGAQAGPAVGVRFRTALSGPIDLSISTTYIRSKRFTINTTLPESTRVQGPIDYNLISADIALGLTLTGGKTWHGLAPYVAMGMGVVAPTRTVTDPVGYRAGMGFSLVPTIGLRARLGRVLGLQIEARDNTVRYEWPLRYFDPVDNQGNPLPPILNNVRDKHTTHNLTLSAGLSYHFNF